MAIAQGQFTIVDYNDAITLSGYLASSVRKNQRYMKDSGTYLPDWSVSSSNPVITPYLFRAGSDEDLMTEQQKHIVSVKWYANNTLITAGESYEFEQSETGYSAQKFNHKLKIKKNIMNEVSSGLEIRCEITYFDEASQLTMTQSLTISYTFVLDGGGLVAIEVTTPNGEVFKNNQVTALTIQTKLFRGTVQDISDVEYKWAFQNGDITSSSTGKYDSHFGEGWEVLASGAHGCSISGNVLTVPSSMVPSILTFKCAAIDKEKPKPEDWVWYIDGITLVDRSDPIEVIISSTGGNVFKNGNGETRLTANVYQGGTQISADKCLYKWYHYDKDGKGAEMSGKTSSFIDIDGDDVEVKATFLCQVTYPKE